MDRPVVLVTGANAGIGRAATAQLAARGAHVVLACRDVGRGERAADAIRAGQPAATLEVLEMDLASTASIAGACDAFRAAGHRRLDALIHNAADFDLSRTAPRFTEDGIESLWATNHLGPVRLTLALAPELAASPGPRVVTVASKGLVLFPRLRVHLDDPEFRERPFSVQAAYYQSKLAQVMYTAWLAERHRTTGLIATCVRVPNVRIDLARYPDLRPVQRWAYGLKQRFAITPEAMAETYVWLALDPEVARTTGAYVDERRRPVQPNAWARDPANVAAVMALTERYVPELRDGGAAPPESAAAIR